MESNIGVQRASVVCSHTDSSTACCTTENALCWFTQQVVVVVCSCYCCCCGKRAGQADLKSSIVTEVDSVSVCASLYSTHFSIKRQLKWSCAYNRRTKHVETSSDREDRCGRSDLFTRLSPTRLLLKSTESHHSSPVDAPSS